MLRFAWAEYLKIGIIITVFTAYIDVTIKYF